MKCKQDYPNTQTSFVHPITYIFYTFEKQRDTIYPALLSGIGAPLGKKFMKWFRRWVCQGQQGDNFLWVFSLGAGFLLWGQGVQGAPALKGPLHWTAGWWWFQKPHPCVFGSWSLYQGSVTLLAHCSFSTRFLPSHPTPPDWVGVGGEKGYWGGVFPPGSFSPFVKAASQVWPMSALVQPCLL